MEKTYRGWQCFASFFVAINCQNKYEKLSKNILDKQTGVSYIKYKLDATN